MNGESGDRAECLSGVAEVSEVPESPCTGRSLVNGSWSGAMLVGSEVQVCTLRSTGST